MYLSLAIPLGRNKTKMQKRGKKEAAEVGEINILEKRRRVIKKNVAILADSLPLSASRHNTMFLKNWQHLLWVYFSCVSEPKQKQATS